MYAQEYWIKIRPLHGPILTIRKKRRGKSNFFFGLMRQIKLPKCKYHWANNFKLKQGNPMIQSPRHNLGLVFCFFFFVNVWYIALEVRTVSLLTKKRKNRVTEWEKNLNNEI